MLVECYVAGEALSTRATNLGGGGLFLVLLKPLAQDTELKVQFRPAKRLPTIKAGGRVRYQIPDRGTGIEFAEISPEDRQLILRFILKRTGDSRKYPRRRFVAQVESEAGVFLGASREIGVGGIFIETKEPVPEGSSLKVRFNLDDGGPIVTATGEVRYSVEDIGIGVLFTDITPNDRNRIDLYVAKSEPKVKTSRQ